MKFFALPFAAAILVGVVPRALADIDPTTGIRVSLTTTQTLLAALPLPNLTAQENSASVQATYFSAAVSGDSEIGSPGGSFTGGALTVGASSRPKRGLSVFGIFSGNRSEAKINNSPGPAFENFTASGFSAALGVSQRILGQSRDPLMFGLFGGPAVMDFRSSFKIGGFTFQSSPMVFGVLAGAQLRLAMGPVFLIPYVLRFQEVTEACKIATSDGGDLGGVGCDNRPNQTRLPATFDAVGLSLGFASSLTGSSQMLSINAFSHMTNAIELSDIKITNYSLGYGFGF